MSLLFFFSIIQLTVGLCCRVGSGVSMGPLGADMQPPPSSADSAWFLTQNSGFAGHDDDGRRNRAPPLKPPWFFEQETATELGFRFPFFCGFKYQL